MAISQAQYATFRQGLGFHELRGRTLIEMLGADRAKVLHGLCTNDIKQLVPGSGCEAFLTNVQGRTIGYVYVTCGAESLLLDTAPGFADTIIPALDRYVIREDVRFVDRSADTSTVLIGGPQVEGCLTALCSAPPPASILGHVQSTIAGIAVEICRVPYASPDGYFLRCAVDSVETVCDALVSQGALRCDAEVIETARIEMGTPIFGIDITPDNLPQEVGRDQQAISFNKGCYLGQETVARIDALGHVNQQLMGLKFSGDQVPTAGTVLSQQERQVARVTSACWSPTRQAPLALAYVRRGHDQVGGQLDTEFGRVEVVALPVR